MRKLNLILMKPLGRSGSVFLHNLLDSHPEIITIPIYFPFYYFWSLIDTTKSIEKIIDDYLNFSNLNFLFKASKHGISDELKIETNSGNTIFQINKSRYKEFILEEFYGLKKNENSKRASILLALHLGYSKLMGGQANNERKYILLHEHYAYNYCFVKKDFPNFKDVVIYRNPYDSFSSYNKLSQKDKSIMYGINFISGIVSWHHNTKNSFLSYNKTFFLKIESINENLEDNINNLCFYLNIKSDPTMYTPTISGFLSSTYKNSASTKKIKSSKYSISKRDKEIVKSLFDSILLNYCESNNSLLIRKVYYILVPSLESFLSINGFRRKVYYIITFSFLFKRLLFLSCLIKKKQASVPLFSKLFLIPYRKYFKNV